MSSKFLYISWQDFHRTCFELSKKITASKIKIDRILAISRGGLIVARILSDFLDLPISVFTIVAYTDIAKMKKPKVVEGLKADIKSETVLLVDEVADSGHTYQVGLEYLQQFGPKKIISCAPYIKSKTTYTPDFWQQKVETGIWFIFPYEVRETVGELKKELTRDNLVSLGLVPRQVDYYLD